MIRKISPLMKFQILEVFVNTLTTDYKYPVPDCENLLIILNTKKFFSVFCSIYGIYINF